MTPKRPTWSIWVSSRSSIEVKKALTPRGGYSPAHGEGPWFVSVHDGDGEWAFLGTVQRWLNPKTGAASHTYKPSPKSKYAAGSPQQRGAAFRAVVAAL